jgi:hypothetical protein
MKEKDYIAMNSNNTVVTTNITHTIQVNKKVDIREFCCSTFYEWYNKKSIIYTTISGIEILMPNMNIHFGDRDGDRNASYYNVEIKFCPFCGKEIKYKEVHSDN